MEHQTIKLIIALSIAIWTAVTGWIVAVRTQIRMKKSLGRKPSNLEMVSLNTWMQVEEVEQRAGENKPIHPR
jgi:hypothetical protein